MRVLLVVVTLFVNTNIFANEETPELVIEKIKNGLYLHKSFSHVDGFGLVSSNGLVVVDQAKAFIVDTPWSEQDTQQLVQWIKDQHYEVLGSISTHSHADRTAGIKWLNAHSIPTYAPALTNQILQQQQKAQASHTLDGTEAILADGMLEVFYPGPGHAIDNMVVWLPTSKVLFGGCLVRSLDAKNLGFTGEAFIEQWAKSVEQVLLKYPDATLVIPGHGAIGDLQLLQHTKTLAELAAKKIQEPA